MSSLTHGIPLYLQMRQELRTEILEGKVRPGERLGTEEALMERFQVSRITVRKALAGLVDERLVRRVRGGGTFVSPRHTRAFRPRQRTGHIAIQTVDLHTALGDTVREIARGIASVLEASGLASSLFLISREEDGAAGKAIFYQALTGGRLDGVISMWHMGRDAYLRMLELGVPVVLTFDYEGLDLPAVSMDLFKLFEEVTSLVVQAGWRAPALIKGPSSPRPAELLMRDMPFSGFRAAEGFRCGLIQHGLPYHPGRVLCCSYRPDEAPALVGAARRLRPEPDVLIVDGVEMAAAIRKAVKDEMVVIEIGARMENSPAPAIEIPSFEIGRRAAEMLLRRMETLSAPVAQEFLRLDIEKARAKVFEARKQRRTNRRKTADEEQGA